MARREAPTEPVLLRDIAKAIDAPEAFLSKIFQSLRAAGLVLSHRGTSRGYGLALDASEISIYDVIVAAEGSAALHTSRVVAQQAGMPFAQVWQEVEELVADKLHSTTISELAAQSATEAPEHTSTKQV